MVFYCILIGASSLILSDTSKSQNTQVILDQVIVSAPASYSEFQNIEVLDAESLKEKSLGQDLPQIISNSLSVVNTSDAGNNVGYSGMRIRGCDLGSVQVSLNGVSMNEQESQEVYFVDIPDLLNSLGKVEIIRGNGNLLNSASSGFGGSLLLATKKNKSKSYVDLSSSYGSFNTYRGSVTWGSGLISNHFSIEGMTSIIGSDGYVDRASSNLASNYLHASYENNNITVEFIYIGGQETTYQAWYGIDEETLKIDRKYNPAGEIIKNGEVIGFYDNQIDDFSQNYFQFLTTFKWNKWNIQPILYYKNGNGYYQNYNNNLDLTNSYGSGLFSFINNNISNSIDQKWLNTKFVGGMIHFNKIFNRLVVNSTIDANNYLGENYGYLLWADNATLIDGAPQWYSSPGRKKSAQLLLNLNYQLNSKFRLYSQFQYKYIDYSAQGTLESLRPIDWHEIYQFINPGISLSYIPNKKIVYSVSAAVSHREPNRSSLEQAGDEGIPKYETLFDLELGLNYKQEFYKISLNTFAMLYNNQLVPNGEINSVGAYISTNVNKSFRIGLEAELKWNPTRRWEYHSNISISKNGIKDYTYYVDNFDTGSQDAVYLKRTPISFSPNIVGSQVVNYNLVKDVTLAWELKYVGSQYLDNTNEKSSMLNSYCVNNINFTYSRYPSWCKKLVFTAVFQNILNTKYQSNGWSYWYIREGIKKYDLGYYPQACANLMLGLKISL